jgi:hypothetical protein
MANCPSKGDNSSINGKKQMPGSSFLEAQLTYESLGTIDIDESINNLDKALQNYNKITCISSPSKTSYSGTPLNFVGDGDIQLYNNNQQFVLLNDGKFPRASGQGYVITGPNIPPNTTVTNYRMDTSNPSSRYNVIFMDLSNPVPNVDTSQPVYYSPPGSTQGSSLGDTCIPTATDLDRKRMVVETAFAPISEYYTKLAKLNITLQNYIGKAATNIEESDNTLASEERYKNRTHPEESMRARESHFPELRMTTIPYLLAASVFMASLSILLVFQINGFTAQLVIPNSFINMFIFPAGEVPFYKDPMVLGGIGIILSVMTIIFAVLYFRSKNTNKG